MSSTPGSCCRGAIRSGWRAEQSKTDALRHPSRFNAMLETERMLERICKPWQQAARGRDTWKKLESEFVRRFDPPWSSGKQPSLENLAPKWEAKQEGVPESAPDYLRALTNPRDTSAANHQADHGPRHRDHTIDRSCYTILHNIYPKQADSENTYHDQKPYARGRKNRQTEQKIDRQTILAVMAVSVAVGKQSVQGMMWNEHVQQLPLRQPGLR